MKLASACEMQAGFPIEVLEELVSNLAACSGQGQVDLVNAVVSRRLKARTVALGDVRECNRIGLWLAVVVDIESVDSLTHLGGELHQWEVFHGGDGVFMAGDVSFSTKLYEEGKE